MANPHRGEVDIEIGGETWTLRLTLNAMCEIEEQTGKGLPEIVNILQHGKAGGFSGMRAIVCAAARSNLPDLTPEMIGEMIDISDMQKIGHAINQLVSRSAPDGTGDENPQAAAAD